MAALEDTSHDGTAVICGSQSLSVGVNAQSRQSYNGTLNDELSRLAGCNLDDLRVRYRQLARKGAPSHLPRWLLLRMVAYRLQANVLGDLDAETARYLDRVAKDQARTKAERAAEGGAKSTAKRTASATITIAPVPNRLRPGTQLVREFNGDLHRVIVLETGFSWGGRAFSSLSEVARAITGTSWNGPAFFGLRPRNSTKQSASVSISSAVAGAP